MQCHPLCIQYSRLFHWTPFPSPTCLITRRIKCIIIYLDIKSVTLMMPICSVTMLNVSLYCLMHHHQHYFRYSHFSPSWCINWPGPICIVHPILHKVTVSQLTCSCSEKRLNCYYAWSDPFISVIVFLYNEIHPHCWLLPIYLTGKRRFCRLDIIR